MAIIYFIKIFSNIFNIILNKTNIIKIYKI